MTLFKWIEDKIIENEQTPIDKQVLINDVKEFVNYYTIENDTQDILTKNLITYLCQLITSLIKCFTEYNENNTEENDITKLKLLIKQYIISYFVSDYTFFYNLFILHYILARDKTNLQDRTITVRSFEELQIKFPEIIEKSKSDPSKLYCVHLHRGHGLGAIIQNGKFLLIDSLGVGNGFKYEAYKESFKNNELRYFESYNENYLGKMSYECMQDKKLQNDSNSCHTFFATMSSIINKLTQQEEGSLENVINKYGKDLGNKSYDLTSIFYHIGQSSKYFNDQSSKYTLQNKKLDSMIRKGYIKPKKDNTKQQQNTYIQQHKEEAENELVNYIQDLPIEEQEKLVNDVFKYFTGQKRFDIHIDFKEDNMGKTSKKSKEIKKLILMPDLNYSCTLIENDIKTNNLENLQKHMSVIDNIDDINFNNEPSLFYFMSIINNNTDPQIIRMLIDKNSNLSKTNSNNKTIKDIVSDNNNIDKNLKYKIIRYIDDKIEIDYNLNKLNSAKEQLKQIHWTHTKRRNMLKEKIQYLKVTLEFLNKDLNIILSNQEINIQI